MSNTKPRSAINVRSALGARLAASAVALALFVSACAGDDETPKGGYSEPCTTTPDCAEGLECFTAIGICSQGCAAMDECRARLGAPAAVCVGGVCQEPCSPTDPCTNGLMCIQSQAGATCRDR